MNFQVFAYNDYHLLLRLLTNEGNIDINHFLCSNEGALKWGNDLFKYYMKDAIPIENL